MEKFISVLLLVAVMCTASWGLIKWWRYWDDRGDFGFFMSLPFPIIVVLALIATFSH